MNYIKYDLINLLYFYNVCFLKVNFIQVYILVILDGACTVALFTYTEINNTLLLI